MKNVCITGYGAIGPIHASAIEKTENASLYAVCDINKERLETAKKLYNVKTYTDFDIMLEDKEIDTVHICTPHYLHFEMIKKALCAGKGVVCEKPVTMTPDEYNELLKLKGIENVCVVFQNRLNPSVVKLKEIIESGKMGKINAVKGILTWNRSLSYYKNDEWRGKWATEGGGVLINQAVHTLDLFCYLVGNVKSVKAVMTNFSLNELEVEDTFNGYLCFEDGKTGIFFATNAYTSDPSPEFEVEFEEGKVRYVDSNLYLNGKLIEEDIRASEGKSYWGVGHRMLISNYYDKGIFFNPLDAKNTMETLFAMYESAKKNGQMTIV